MGENPRYELQCLQTSFEGPWYINSAGYLSLHTKTVMATAKFNELAAVPYEAAQLVQSLAVQYRLLQ